MAETILQKLLRTAKKTAKETTPARPTTVVQAPRPELASKVVAPKPIAPRPTGRLTWEEAQPLIRANPLLNKWTQDDFNKAAASEGMAQWDAEEPVRQARVEQRNAIWQQDYEFEQQKDVQSEYERELDKRFENFRAAQQALAIGDDATPYLRDTTDMLATLLAQDGTSEEQQAARSTAAGMLANNQALLKPFIETQLGEDWWEKNYERIQANLDWRGRTQYWDREDGLGELPGKIASNVGLVAGEAASTDVGRYLINVLKQTGEGAALTLGAGRAAVDPNDDVSVTDAIKFGASTVGNIPVSVAAALVGQDRTGSRFIEGADGRLFSFDLDGDGTVNLREATGRDPDYGGRALGAIDTLGLAAIDPATWFTLSPAVRARAGIRALEMSDNSAARMAGTRLRNGAKLADLSDIESVQARASWARTSEEAAIRSRRYRIAENAGRSADQLEKLAEKITQRQVAKIEQAVAQGSVPGVRIGGTTVIPMRRLYNAVGIIDSRLAQESAWTLKFADTINVKKSQDFLTFVHNWKPGDEIPEPVRDSMRSWDTVAGKFDENTWKQTLRGLLWRAPDPAQQFDEIEAFGRALFGDAHVAEWRPWFEGTLRPKKKGQFNQRATPYEPWDIDEVSDVGRANMRIIDEGGEWVGEGSGLRGVRSLYNAEGALGRIYRGFANAMSPGASIKNSETLGRRVWQDADQVVNEAAANRQLAYDMAELLQINANRESLLEKAAAAELPNTWMREVDKGLVDKRGIGPAVARLTKDGNTATATLLKALDKMRRITDEVSAQAGGDVAPRTPRVRSEGAQRFAVEQELKGNVELNEALANMGLLAPRGRRFDTLGEDKLRQGGAFATDPYEEAVLSITELNKRARKDLIDAGLHPDVAEGFQLYEPNPVTAMMMRSRQAQEARVYSSMLDGMAQVKAPNGRPLAYHAPTADDVKSVYLQMKADDAAFGMMKYDVVNLPNGGRYWVERTIKDELERTRRIVGSTADMGVIKKFATMHNNLWGTGVTVVNPAFHARNGVGNAFNMFLAGMRDPRFFKEAVHFQQLAHQVNVAMREGLNLDEAILKAGVKPGDARILRDLRKFDLAGQNRVTDLLNEYDPLNPESTNRLADNRVVHAGRDLGSFIENNARVALYLDGIEKGMTPKVASARVREFLFDYQDLTQFEAENIRMASRFYTFTRKNTALQARMLATQPGTIINANRVLGEFQDLVMSAFGFERNEDGSVVVPEYLEGVQSYVKTGTDEEGNPISQRVFADLESPFDAFLKTGESLSSLVMMPAWITAAVARPGEGLPAASDHMRQITQLLSGGPVEIINTAHEYQSQKDSFTGRDLSMQDRTWVDRMTRFTDLFFPPGSLIDRNLEGFGLYEALGVMQDPDYVDNNQGRARLANTMMGMQLYFQENRALDKTSPEFLTVIKEMEDALYDAQEGIPYDERLRIDDLVEMGELSTRNDVLAYILYNGRMPDDFTQEDIDWLDKQLPDTVQADLGIRLNDKEPTPERTPAEAVKLARERIEAARALGVVVDQAMEDDILKYSSGLTMSEAEDGVGFGAYRPQNPYRQDLGLEAHPDAIARANQKFMSETLALMGRGSLAEFIEDNPVLTSFDLKVSQMREAGYEEDEIVAEVLETLSRERQALIFGEDSLDMFKVETPYSTEQLKKMDEAVANEVTQMDWLWLYQFGRRPTAQERDNYIAQVFFTKPEQERVGVEPYSAPSREDKTSDETWLRRQVQEAEVVDRVAGTNYSSRLRG